MPPHSHQPLVWAPGRAAQTLQARSPQRKRALLMPGGQAQRARLETLHMRKREVWGAPLVLLRVPRA